MSAESEEESRHHQKMAKKKVVRDRLMATKTEARGLLMVHTGTGKGKSSAAFGMALRCVGHDMRVGVIQFIKGAWDTAERRVLSSLGEQVVFKAMGEGFTWETQDRARDIAAAERAWAEAQGMLADPGFAMVILDELNIVLRYGYLPLEPVLMAIQARPHHQHVVVTGRNALEPLIAAADLVTEMTMVKHPFRSGVKAQPGVEY